MARTLRDVIESIVFAGMKPGAPAAPLQRKSWLGRRWASFDRLLSGAAPSDPLYLTRRTLGQRMKFAAAVGIPCLIVAGVMGLALTNYFVKKTAAPKLDMSPGERAAKMLPKMDKVTLDTNRDVDVMEVRVDRSKGVALTGTVMNNTSHTIETAEIVFDLFDNSGSQLGGVSQRIQNLPQQIRQPFRLPIEQTTASFALVREVRTH